PAHRRTRAEGAAVIAPFAYLEVTYVRQIAGVNANPRVTHFRPDGEKSALDQLGDEPAALRCAEKQIHFRQLGGELGPVPLDHATDCHNGAALAALLVSGRAD